MTNKASLHTASQLNAASVSFDTRKLWYFLMNEVAGELTSYPARQPCVRCHRITTSFVCVHAGNIGLSCEIPVPVCPACLQRPPFALKPAGFRRWAALSLLLLAVIAAAAKAVRLALFLIGCIPWLPLLMQSPRRITPAQQDRQLQQLPQQVELLKYVGDNLPGFRIQLPPQLNQYSSSDVHHASRFQASLREYSRLTMLITNAELQQSEIDPRLLHTLLVRVKALLAAVVSSVPGTAPLALQIDCAVLPGRRIEFELHSTLPESHPTRQELLTELHRTPPIGTRWPVIFSVRFTNRSGHALLNEETRPFITWHHKNPRLTWAHIALEFFNITPDPLEALLTIPDCFAWQALGLLDNSLAADLSDLLLAEQRSEEALSVLEKQISLDSNDQHLLHKFAWLLGQLNQNERAAAACQQLIRNFPDYPAGWGMLASLQLQMQRPQDAEITLLSAPKSGRSADFWITSADVAAAHSNYDSALSLLNVAILKDLGCVPALLRKAEIFSKLGMNHHALQNIDFAERLQHTSPDLISLKARLLAELRQTQEAITTLSRGLELFPDQGFLRFLRADLLLSIGKPALALEDCSAVLQSNPDFIAAYELQSLILLEYDDPESAVTAADHAIASEHAGYRAWFARGLARLQLQQYQLATEDLEHACQLSADDARPRYALAQARMACGDADTALAELNTLLSYHPDDSDALSFRGFLHIANGNSDLAAHDFQQAIDVAPHLLSPVYGLSIVKRLAGDHSAALALLDAALQKDPSHEACLLDRARLLATKDNLQDAAHDLSTILENDPTCLPALLSRAQMRLHLGNLDDARKDFNAILQQEPESTEALIGRSVLSEKSGDLTSAQQDLQKANEINPDDTEGVEIARLRMQATIAHRAEQFDEAIAACSLALQIDPNHVHARRDRARNLWYSDCFVEALEDYQYLIQLAENPDADLLCCRGGIYNELGEFDLALEDLENSRQLAIMDQPLILPYTLSNLARTFTALERWKDADAAFSECLRLDHNSPWLHYYHALYFVARNDPANAVRCFELALSITSRRLPPGKRTRTQAFLKKLKHLQ